MTRESEFVELLRADTALGMILTGGVYAYSDLGEEGVTDPATTPDAYEDGDMLPNAVVKEHAEIPTGLRVDFIERVMDSNQRVEVWIYAKWDESAAINAAKSRIYTVVMGYPFSRGWPTIYIGSGMGILPAPSLPSAKMLIEGYQVHGTIRPTA